MKHWYLPLDVGNWFADTRITAFSASSRGIWVDLKCRMHNDDRCGIIEGDLELLSKLARCSTMEMQVAIETIKSIAEVHEQDAVFTIIDPLMRKEYKTRKQRELRNSRYREKKSSLKKKTPHETLKKCNSFNYSYGSSLRNGESSREGPDPPPPERSKTSPAEFMGAWNSIQGVSACREMTKERTEKLTTRLKNERWFQDWPSAMVKLDKSSFCKGGGNTGWRADIDWFMRPGTVTALLEGKYDDKQPRQIQAHLPTFIAPT